MKNIKNNSILNQLSIVSGNKLAGAVGAIIACAPVYASHHIAHHYTQRSAWFWILVAGALASSSPKVYRWTKRTFGTGFEALGYIVVTELAMVTTSGSLSWFIFGILTLINGVEGAYKLVCERSDVAQQTRQAVQTTQAKRRTTRKRSAKVIPLDAPLPVDVGAQSEIVQINSAVWQN